MSMLELQRQPKAWSVHTFKCVAALYAVHWRVPKQHRLALCCRGWVPLLRLLEAVPAWEEASTISAAFQCVESVSRCAAAFIPDCIHIDTLH
jgi:hypothetical protein